MLLELSHIRRAEEHVERIVPSSELEGEDNAYRAVEPAQLAFGVQKEKDAFRLTGSVRSTLSLTCSRCLEPFRFPVKVSFDQRYLPQADASGDVDREVETVELDASFYRDEQIDLGELVREQFYLVLPMKPLCTDACRGLCSQCGTNLNISTCGCTFTWDDPRLAPLKRFR